METHPAPSAPDQHLSLPDLALEDLAAWMSGQGINPVHAARVLRGVYAVPGGNERDWARLPAGLNGFGSSKKREFNCSSGTWQLAQPTALKVCSPRMIARSEGTSSGRTWPGVANAAW